MAIIINDNLAINVGKPVDSKYMNISTPWTSVLDANSNIPLSYRYLGLTVNINNVEYWYKDSLADVGLIIKSMGGSLTGATNGISLINGGKSVSLGGALTGNTTFDGNGLNYHLKYAGDYSSSFTNRSIPDKEYVDGIASGLQPKQAVLVATTGDTVLSGLTIVDNVQLSFGDRVLAKNQINDVDNGIYSASTGTWGRTSDFDGSPASEVITGSYMWVLSGDTNMNSAWVLTTPDPVVVGVSGLTFVLFSAVQDVLAGVGIIVTQTTGVHYVAFDGASVAGDGLSWNGAQLNVTDISDMSGATNGLTRRGSNATLGGTLTGDTFIELPTGVKRSFIVGQDAGNWHGGRIEVCTDTILTGDTAFIGARHDASCYSQIRITAMSGMTLSTCYSGLGYGNSHSVRLGNRALEYGANYCSDFYTNPRSIPDVGYVTGQTGSISANNGLSRKGNNIVLGGALTGDTTISGGSFNFVLGSTSNKLNNLCINTSNIPIRSSGATYTDLNPTISTRKGIEYGACYHSGYTNRSLVDKEYVTKSISTSGNAAKFTSDITVSIASGKTFGRYRNLDVIPASGKTANEVILMSLNEPLVPTLSLSSSSSILYFGLASKSVQVTMSYVINSLGATVSTAVLEWRRNNTGSWSGLTANPLLVTYAHTINDSLNRFNATVINYRYTVVDNLGGSGRTTYNITPTAYVAPTIAPTYTGSVLSYETQTLREIGNKNTTVAGSINETNAGGLVNITAYRIMRSVNGGAFSTIATETSLSTLSKTITSFADSSASASATSIAYKIGVDDEFTSTTGSTYTITLRYASYYGYSTNTSLTDPQIVALGNQALLASRARTMVLTAPVSNYTYVSYPASYGDLTSAIMDGAAPVLGAFTKLTAVTVTNGYGQAVSNNVYKSNATQAFTANSVAFA